MIDIRDVHKTYHQPRGLLETVRRPRASGAATEVLRAIDLHVEPGEVHGLLGPNGAGKTTLLKMVVNLVTPTSGTVVVDGHDVSVDPVGVRRSVGYVSSDERSFFWRLSGYENLRFFAALHGIERAEAERRIAHHLDVFGLGDLAHRRFGLHSSGRKKLFTVIRGLLPEPPVLVFDESTNSLDPHSARRLEEYVTEELAGRRRCTVLWATHRLEEIGRLCHRVTLIHGGTRRFHGTVGDFADAGQGSGGSLADVFDALLQDDPV